MDESFIVPFLSKYYQIVKVEKENQLDEIYITNQITKRHILLVIQDYNKSEKSMSVIYNDIIYHNFSMMPLKPLEFLNRPLSSVFVLKKK